jgi:hypothetical protein
VDAVQSAVQRGLSAEEAQAQVACPDPYPMQPGILMKESDVNAGSIRNLYDLSTKRNSKETQRKRERAKISPEADALDES